MSVSEKIRAAGIAAGAALLAALAPLSPAAPSEVPESVAAPALELGKAFAAVAAHVKPGVVSVFSEKMVTERSPQPGLGGGPGQRQVPERGLGSGMILDGQGHILTNYHVVSGVDKIRVQLADGRNFVATIVGADPKTDVAIIRIGGPVPPDLPTVQLGDSDALEDGDLVMAIGAPFGLTQTVTSGIVSAKGRSDMGLAAYEDFIQTDAPINPGNSGGPLVNMRGEVIGMNSAIATGGEAGQSSGVGFAIPSNMIRSMLPTLIRGGRIVRGMLGVEIQDLTPALAEQFHVPEGRGALIAQVGSGTPAARARLKVGDVIVRYGSTTISDGHQLRNLVAATAPGTKVVLGVVRDGKEQSIEVTIGTLPSEAAAETRAPSGKAAGRLAEVGLQVQTLTPELAARLNLQGEKGVVISAVEPGSPASDADLRPGDLITEVDRTPIASVRDLQKVLEKAKNQVLLLVKRGDESAFVILGFK